MTERIAELTSFSSSARALIIGGSGGIGGALSARLSQIFSDCVITSRSGADGAFVLDVTKEQSWSHLADQLSGQSFDMIVNATGLLHGQDVAPERRLTEISIDQMQSVFAVNSFGVALGYKYLLPCLAKQDKAVFANLSARVGSISDNKIGGWYSYRAAKAAQNMITKSAAIEWQRRHKNAILVGLHPGTVSTDLSAPFRGSVAADKLFTPDQSADYLLRVIDGLEPEDNGYLFAWDGSRVEF
jgi:NAD(P)-dependent dehydrogenase (short-subunit alcohol dehydrogenase family)